MMFPPAVRNDPASYNRKEAQLATAVDAEKGEGALENDQSPQHRVGNRVGNHSDPLVCIS